MRTVKTFRLAEQLHLVDQYKDAAMIREARSSILESVRTLYVLHIAFFNHPTPPPLSQCVLLDVHREERLSPSLCSTYSQNGQVTGLIVRLTVTKSLE